MNVATRVENILRASRAARNSDTELLIIYMQKSGMDLSPLQMDKFRNMPSPETIRRTRQKLQEQGKFPADEAVDKARFEKYRAVKSNIKSESPEKLLEAQGYHVKPYGE